MLSRLRHSNDTNGHDRFPPEAGGDFDVVTDREIADWQQKLNERFGIGSGRLVVVEEPASDD